MDIVESCRVLVEIAERGTVTRAAAALAVAQSVASRRIMTLEQHLGAPLLERNSRRAVLTPFARDLLHSARRLIRLADELELDAERARLRPVTIALPQNCSTRDLAVTEAAGRATGLRLEFQGAPPGRRAELLAAFGVRLALLATPADEAQWAAVLGAAGRRRADRPLRLEGLRPSRREQRRDDDTGARLRIGPEDDLPHIRDILTRTAFSVGLAPGQLPVDASMTSSLAAVLADGDLMLCTDAEARDLGLHWRPFIGLKIERGFTLAGNSGHDVRVVTEAVGDELAAALGAKVTMKIAEAGDG